MTTGAGARAGDGPLAEAGHTRTIVLADGFTVLEAVTEVPARVIGYTLTRFTRGR